MTEVLTSPPLTVNHLMCSSSSNIQDLTACSGHSPSCMIGSDPEPDTSSRQEYNPSSLPPTMGLNYMTNLADDPRFPQDSNSSHSAVYPLESTVHSTSPSTLPFSSYQYLPSHATYPSGSHYYPTSSIGLAVPDIKQRLHAIAPGLGSLSRSPALPYPVSPTRELYNTSSTPLFSRRTSDLLSRSPSSSGIVRGPLSPSSSSGFASPVSNMDGSLGGSPCPPLGDTEVLYSLQTSDSPTKITPQIFARIDKGFFMADGDWTCYRRNYFSLNCSYTLSPTIPNGSIYLVQQHGLGPQVHQFAMSIAAVVDGRDGKSIDLVQHTPKRDKGPQEKPGRITLAPRPSPPHGMYDGGLSSGRYDQSFNQNSNQPSTEATFERIQFKNATANNGKRRAAQQYYHLLVELFADIGSHVPQNERWVKIAYRMSHAMVVRGRSPGHYQSDRRGSNSSSGPGPGGVGGSGSYTPGASRTAGDITMSGTSSMLSNSSYYDRSSHHYRSNMAGLQIPLEPALSPEEAKSLDEAPPSYMYYPGVVYQHERSILPSMSEYATNKVKHEYSASSYQLPSLSSYDGLPSRCGRFDGFPESKGYFPNTMMQQELNMT